MKDTDSEFVLIADNGDRLYPYKKHQKVTGRYGYALTGPGEKDRNGQGTYTEDLAFVIRRVVIDGWKVRAKTVDSKRNASYAIGKTAIAGYEINKKYLTLVSGAAISPLKIIAETEPKSIDEAAEDKSSIDTQSNVVDERALREILTRRGQPEFRRKMLSIFGGRCCITGCDVQDVLEAAHIMPHVEGQDYSADNGLLMRSDIHTLFDLNLIQIDENGVVYVASDLHGSEYELHAGRQVAPAISSSMRSNLLKRRASIVTP